MSGVNQPRWLHCDNLNITQECFVNIYKQSRPLTHDECCAGQHTRNDIKSPSISPTVSTGRMTNQTTVNQSNTNKNKEKEENLRDDTTEVVYKDAGYCSRNTHNLLLGLTVMGMHEHAHATLLLWRWLLLYAGEHIFRTKSPHS